MLITPFLLSIFFPKEDNINIENRETKEKPIFPCDTMATGTSFFKKGKILGKEYKKYASQYGDYYADNFYFRNEFIKLYNQIKLKSKTSSVERSAVLGTDGWLFLGNTYSDIIYENLGYKPLSNDELEKILEQVKEWKRFCDSLNVTFIITITPDKQTIYNEYFPIKGKVGPSRLDQVSKLLKMSDVNYIHITDTLLAEKKNKQLYYKTDSHWNFNGAYLAYSKIFQKIRELEPKISLITMDDIDIVNIKTKDFDIAKMMSLDIEEDNPIYNITTAHFTVEKSYIQSKKGIYDYYECQTKNTFKDGKIVVFGDSYYNAMYFFTAASAGEIIFYQGVGRVPFDKQLIEREKPNVVIFEIVERCIETIMDEPFN